MIAMSLSALQYSVLIRRFGPVTSASSLARYSLLLAGVKVAQVIFPGSSWGLKSCRPFHRSSLCQICACSMEIFCRMRQSSSVRLAAKVMRLGVQGS